MDGFGIHSEINWGAVYATIGVLSLPLGMASAQIMGSSTVGEVVHSSGSGIQCSKCGKTLPSYARYCGYCGVRVVRWRRYPIRSVFDLSPWKRNLPSPAAFTSTRPFPLLAWLRRGWIVYLKTKCYVQSTPQISVFFGRAVGGAIFGAILLASNGAIYGLTGLDDLVREAIKGAMGGAMGGATGWTFERIIGRAISRGIGGKIGRTISRATGGAIVGAIFLASVAATDSLTNDALVFSMTFGMPIGAIGGMAGGTFRGIG